MSAGTDPAPFDCAPMLAVARELPPDGDGWAYEIKWDGIRVRCLIDADADAGAVRLRSRNGNDISAAYPELTDPPAAARLRAAVGGRGVLLDAELCAFGADGRPSFADLARRMHVRDPAAVARLRGEIPVELMVFDLLWFDGWTTLPLPWSQRRSLLESLGLELPGVHTPPARTGPADGAALWMATKQTGLEGVMAKRVDAPYACGRRSPSWVKAKHRLAQSFVVGGWTSGEGGRSGRVGALLLGVHPVAGDPALAYVGRVGSGMRDADLDLLDALLAPLATDASPFAAASATGDRVDGPSAPHGGAFVRPRLVVDVVYSEWPAGAALRHPVFAGVRDDVDPAGITREVRM